MNRISYLVRRRGLLLSLTSNLWLIMWLSLYPSHRGIAAGEATLCAPNKPNLCVFGPGTRVGR